MTEGGGCHDNSLPQRPSQWQAACGLQGLPSAPFLPLVALPCLQPTMARPPSLPAAEETCEQDLPASLLGTEFQLRGFLLPSLSPFLQEAMPAPSYGSHRPR